MRDTPIPVEKEPERNANLPPAEQKNYTCDQFWPNNNNGKERQNKKAQIRTVCVGNFCSNLSKSIANPVFSLSERSGCVFFGR